MNRKLSMFSAFVTFTMMIVLLMGGTVTKTDSGDGCGTDWPLCHGELIPTNPSVETMIEYSHRAVTGVVGLLIIALCLWTLVAFKDRLDTKIFAFLAFIFMLIQSLVGAGAVVWQQSDLVMALHFGISLISFAALLILTILIMERPGQEFRESVPAFLRKILYGLLVYTLIVVYTGAYVRHVGATYACVGWPVCSQPSMTFEAWVQMIHRIMAGLLFLYTLFVHITAIRLKHRTTTIGMAFATFFISCQVATGAWIVLGGHATYVPLLHAFLITCYFGVLSYLTYHAFRTRKANSRLQ
ncbi:heme A synthase [Exiguobacterium sp.]|uniref:COX15/CtaA family protein n=1 Tax=Exiguobacterium sp. TaxID=44751 RepID=UPI0028B1EC1B|nr:heme A synthase [Exiguobacterium sp.]